jgi:CRISPR-associated protein Cmr5
MAHKNILEQGRAKQAFTLAKKRIANAGKKKDEFKSYSKKIPMLIKTCGIGATFAFMQAKGGTYDCILQDIRTWLSSNEFRIVDVSNDANLVEVMIDLESSKYRAVTTEVLAFMGWYRRFVEGLTSDKKCKEASEEQDKNS